MGVSFSTFEDVFRRLEAVHGKVGEALRDECTRSWGGFSDVDLAAGIDAWIDSEGIGRGLKPGPVRSVIERAVRLRAQMGGPQRDEWAPPGDPDCGSCSGLGYVVVAEGDEGSRRVTSAKPRLGHIPPENPREPKVCPPGLTKARAVDHERRSFLWAVGVTDTRIAEVIRTERAGLQRTDSAEELFNRSRRWRKMARSEELIGRVDARGVVPPGLHPRLPAGVRGSVVECECMGPPAAVEAIDTGSSFSPVETDWSGSFEGGDDVPF